MNKYRDVHSTLANYPFANFAVVPFAYHNAVGGKDQQRREKRPFTGLYAVEQWASGPRWRFGSLRFENEWLPLTP